MIFPSPFRWVIHLKAKSLLRMSFNINYNDAGVFVKPFPLFFHCGKEKPYSVIAIG